MLQNNWNAFCIMVSFCRLKNTNYVCICKYMKIFMDMVYNNSVYSMDIRGEKYICKTGVLYWGLVLPCGSCPGCRASRRWRSWRGDNRRRSGPPGSTACRRPPHWLHSHNKGSIMYIFENTSPRGQRILVNVMENMKMGRVKQRKCETKRKKEKLNGNGK